MTGEAYTSHDFTWEIDTLYNPEALQVNMRDIWGTDENNVWVVGHSDVHKYQAWHWDGSRWENVPLIFPGHPHSLDAIYGFSESDIWIVGTEFQNYPNIFHRSFIIHYDGSTWTHFDELDAPMALSVWGSDPNNVFVGCDSGVVLHYDGINWQEQSTGTTAQMVSFAGVNTQHPYAIGIGLDDLNPYDSTFYYFFESNGNSWEIKDQFILYPFSPPNKFGEKLWVSPDGSIYSAGKDGVYEWVDNMWIKIRKGSFLTIYGTDKNNFLAGGLRNELIHFNGENWYLFEEFSRSSEWFFDIWMKNKHTFVIGRALNRTYIYRGIQKE